MKSSLERLRDLASEQDADLVAHDLEPARARFLASVAGRRPSATWRVRVALAAAAVITGLLFVLLLWPTHALTFAVGSADGRVGAWIAASADEAVPLRFSDGTSLVLQPKGRARVVSTQPAGARVMLESGAVHVAVTHTGASAWSFDAGPLEVHVTGTRFDLAWDPTKQELHLALVEGSVLVTGACLPTPRSVVAGEKLDVFCKEQRAVHGRDVPAPSAVAPSTAPAPVTPPVDPAPTASAAAPPVAPSTSASAAQPPSTWRALFAENRYDEAMRAAEAEGFDALVGRSSAPDLLALADLSRFAGRTSRASEALLGIRNRFAGTSESARAAFHLGRLAFDQRGSHAEAARWFSTYLAEQPSGGLAQEALGRLIECREAMGATSEAREAARRYLAAYPSGPHAAHAESLLAGE